MPDFISIPGGVNSEQSDNYYQSGMPLTRYNLGSQPVNFPTLVRVLRHPKYSELFGKFEYNELTARAELNRRPLDDILVDQIILQCNDKFGMETRNHTTWYPPNFKPDDVWRATRVVAQLTPYHPVRAWLSSLSWDGVKRIDSIASDILDCTNPCQIEILAIRRWLIGAVARAYCPGIKMDNALILVREQGQGAGKSSFFEILGDPWYTCASIDPTSRDGQQIAQSFWIWEWGEMACMRRASDLQALKVFMSRTKDSYVKKYERGPVTVARSYVVGGTADTLGFLVDEQNRRWWIARCGSLINREALQSQKDQIWAEAVVLWHRKERHWFDDLEEAMLRDFQAAHDIVETSPWFELIIAALRKDPEKYARTAQQIIQYPNMPRISNNMLLDLLEIPAAQRTSVAGREINKIMHRLGWEVVQADGIKAWVRS